MSKPDTIKIDEVEYVRKDSMSSNEPAQKLDGMKYVIVRTENAGVFAGYLVPSREKYRITLINARRLWYWEGAASLSQLAMEGVKAPNKCKFPVEVLEVILLGVIEIITVTDAARLSIARVPVWEV